VRGAWTVSVKQAGVDPRVKATVMAAGANQQPVLEMIRQRQSLFRLAFEDRRVTRAMLYRQAEEFERWLSTLASEEPPPVTDHAA
jgi:hypothetical protein